MLSPRGPRGQSSIEAKLLASVTASKLWPRPRPRTWPQTFGLGSAEEPAVKQRLTSLFVDYRFKILQGSVVT